MSNFKTHILIVLILLSAIINGAVSFGVFTQTQNDSAKTVYCPLTKRLQPVNPPEESFKQITLNEICASDDEKIRFSLEIYQKFDAKIGSLNEKQFENLIFDYFQKGKSALNNLPDSPEFPNKNLARDSSSFASFSKNQENQFVWKIQTEKFSFKQDPRSLSGEKKSFPAQDSICKLDKISRKIVPRAPPF